MYTIILPKKKCLNVVSQASDGWKRETEQDTPPGAGHVARERVWVDDHGDDLLLFYLAVYVMFTSIDTRHERVKPAKECQELCWSGFLFFIFSVSQ